MKDRQYNQKLTPDDAAKGISAAIENSKSLLADALLLFDNGRYERAVALAILGIEEAGKPAVLRSIILEDDPKQLKKEWQNYRRHLEKNKNWIVPELISKGARHLEEMRQTVDKKSDHGQMLDNLKQLSFYTDAFSECKWSIPRQVISRELAESILAIAKIMISKDKSNLTSKAELVLWVKHMKPVWKQEMFEMKQALLNCYQEAEDLGLLENGTTKGMVDFLI
jgi:AbiV family abortive infection protein